MKHKEIVRLVNSNQNNHTESKTDNRGEGKRMIGKRGREAPKMDYHEDDMINDN